MTHTRIEKSLFTLYNDWLNVKRETKVTQNSAKRYYYYNYVIVIIAANFILQCKILLMSHIEVYTGVAPMWIFLIDRFFSISVSVSFYGTNTCTITSENFRHYSCKSRLLPRKLSSASGSRSRLHRQPYLVQEPWSRTETHLTLSSPSPSKGT